jgi:hypothetical protein
MQRQLGACACSNNALNKIVAQGRAKGFNQVAKCMKLGRSHKTNACTKNTENKKRREKRERKYIQTNLSFPTSQLVAEVLGYEQQATTIYII